jgi:MFS family permease
LARRDSGILRIVGEGNTREDAGWSISFQAIGMLGAAVTGLLLLQVFSSQDCWRLMPVAGAIPSDMAFVFRIGVPESARWLRQGKIAEAVEILNKSIPGKLPRPSNSKN